MLGVLVPPARAVHVNFGNVLGDDRKMLKSRSGEPAMLLDLVDAAIARGRAIVAERVARAARRRARRARPPDRHRRAEVRRAVQRSHQGLRLRLGPHAVVRGQHRAVPAVRTRPHPQHLPPCRGRPGARCARVVPVARRRPGTGARPAAAAVRRRRARHAREVRPHRLCTYLFELAQTFTSFYDACPVHERRDRRAAHQPTRAVRPHRTGALHRASGCSASSRPSGCSPSRSTVPSLPLHLLPDTATVDDRRFALDRWLLRLRPRRRARHAAVRVRRGPSAPPVPRGRRHVRPPAAPCTPPRRSCAARWPGSRTRRACCSTWPAAASCTSRCRPVCPPTRSPCTATTRASPSCAWPSPKRVRHIVVDSFDELDRLELLHAEGLPVPRVVLRITPGVHAHTHEFIATGQDDSKFGFNLGNGDAHRAVDRMRRSPACELDGVHCHIGSNVFDASTASPRPPR